MSIRDEALFINGVYRGVLDEILLVQRQLPEHIMFLQPYSSERIVRLAKHPPSVDDRVRLFLSTTDSLSMVQYAAELVGWDNKTELPEDKANVIRRLLWTLQPGETGLYHIGGGDKPKSTNLLHVWRMTKLGKPFSVSELILTSTGEPHSTDRTTAGGWSYVRAPDSGWLADRL